ncbi:MAG: DEAD/DEAH box helicase, partial [Comamonadaceae bacterium]
MPTPISDWFQTRGWKPFKFQRDVWRAVAAGESGLLHATTGAGKTYAVWLGALLAFAAPPKLRKARAAAVPAEAPAGRRKAVAPPLTVIWLTPMRALAADTLRALQEPLAALAPHWSAGARSGDTASADQC